MKDQNAIVIQKLKAAGINLLPNNGRYLYCFLVPSESSNALYKVSFDSAPGARYWTCSCRGNIGHGKCKHLRAIGLMGRAATKGLPLNDPRRMLPGQPTY